MSLPDKRIPRKRRVFNCFFHCLSIKRRRDIQPFTKWCHLCPLFRKTDDWSHLKMRKKSPSSVNLTPFIWMSLLNYSLEEAQIPGTQWRWERKTEKRGWNGFFLDKQNHAFMGSREKKANTKNKYIDGSLM